MRSRSLGRPSPSRKVARRRCPTPRPSSRSSRSIALRDVPLQLAVDDGLLDSAPDTVDISTGNSAPVARAGPDQSVPAGVVTLDGSQSSDVDGNALTFTWSSTGAPSRKPGLVVRSACGEAHLPCRSGRDVYSLQLIVHDGTIDSLPDSVVITTENSPARVPCVPTRPCSLPRRSPRRQPIQ